MIRVRYFASLRERLATNEEALAWSESLSSIEAVRAYLRRRGGVWAEALAPEQRVLAAVNQELAQADTQVKDGDEVAFFPPVTGG